MSNKIPAVCTRGNVTRPWPTEPPGWEAQDEPETGVRDESPLAPEALKSFRGGKLQRKLFGQRMIDDPRVFAERVMHVFRTDADALVGGERQRSRVERHLEQFLVGRA